MFPDLFGLWSRATIRPMSPGPLRGKTEGRRSAKGVRVAIVVSRYHSEITDKLLEGAMGEYVARGGAKGDAVVLDAPGSFEVPIVATYAATSGAFDGIVALGCIVKGETSHDHHLATAVTTQILRTSAEVGTPIGLGVLTVNTIEQAQARAGGKLGNKGEEAMAAVLDTLESLDQIDAHADALAEEIERQAAKIAPKKKGR